LLLGVAVMGSIQLANTSRADDERATIGQLENDLAGIVVVVARNVRQPVRLVGSEARREGNVDQQQDVQFWVFNCVVPLFEFVAVLVYEC
jgi:hypothetical protein